MVNEFLALSEIVVPFSSRTATLVAKGYHGVWADGHERTSDGLLAAEARCSFLARIERTPAAAGPPVVIRLGRSYTAGAHLCVSKTRARFLEARASPSAAPGKTAAFIAIYAKSVRPDCVSNTVPETTGHVQRDKKARQSVAFPESGMVHTVALPSLNVSAFIRPLDSSLPPLRGQ